MRKLRKPLATKVSKQFKNRKPAPGPSYQPLAHALTLSLLESKSNRSRK